MYKIIIENNPKEISPDLLKLITAAPIKKSANKTLRSGFILSIKTSNSAKSIFAAKIVDVEESPIGRIKYNRVVFSTSLVNWNSVVKFITSCCGKKYLIPKEN